MFFMFYILVLIIFCSQINSIPRNYNSPEFSEYLDQNDENLTFEDKIRNITYFSTVKPLFRQAKNKDLKSNVFDKMLSDEMFSIKQKIFDKDLVYTSRNVQKNTQSSGQTPTLEIKQKWSVVDLLTEKVSDSITEECSQSVTESYTTEAVTISTENIPSDEPLKKSLDVRSLPPDPRFLARHGSGKCNCLKTMCSSNHGPDCTRSTGAVFTNNYIVPNSVFPFYMPYQPFYVNNMDPLYYQTTQIRPRKTRRRKTTLYDDYYNDGYKYPKRFPDYQSIPSNTETSIVVDIDYDLEEQKRKPPYDQDAELDRIFKERKEKKCYCSIATKCSLHKEIIYVSLILYLL